VGHASAILNEGWAPVVYTRREAGKFLTPSHETRIAKLTTEQELREKLRKIAALFEGATTSGERDAAAAALHRQATVAANVG